MAEAFELVAVVVGGDAVAELASGDAAGALLEAGEAAGERAGERPGAEGEGEEQAEQGEGELARAGGAAVAGVEVEDGGERAVGGEDAEREGGVAVAALDDGLAALQAGEVPGVASGAGAAGPAGGGRGGGGGAGWPRRWGVGVAWGRSLPTWRQPSMMRPAPAVPKIPISGTRWRSSARRAPEMGAALVLTSDPPLRSAAAAARVSFPR